MQTNLLRFLQEKTIHRVGASHSIAVDARVIAASHVNLLHAVQQGNFREDLYYRLNVLALDVPPLRERREDLMLLANHFFSTYLTERSPLVKGFSSAAAQAMLEHGWPGNVRELINRVRRAMVMAEGRLIVPQDLGLACQRPGRQRQRGAGRHAAARRPRRGTGQPGQVGPQYQPGRARTGRVAHDLVPADQETQYQVLRCGDGVAARGVLRAAAMSHPGADVTFLSQQ